MSEEHIEFRNFLDKTRKELLKAGHYFILPTEHKETKPEFRHINNGFCGHFSWAVYEKYGTSVKICATGPDCIDNNDWDLEFGKELPNHYFIQYNGKYYDAECIDGVDDYLKLPLFECESKWYRFKSYMKNSILDLFHRRLVWKMSK